MAVDTAPCRYIVYRTRIGADNPDCVAGTCLVDGVLQTNNRHGAEHSAGINIELYHYTNHSLGISSAAIGATDKSVTFCSRSTSVIIDTAGFFTVTVTGSDTGGEFPVLITAQFTINEYKRPGMTGAKQVAELLFITVHKIVFTFLATDDQLEPGARADMATDFEQHDVIQLVVP